MMKRATKALLALVLASSCTLPCSQNARAQDEAAVFMGEGTELARKLYDPMVAHISAPFQINFDLNGGSKSQVRLPSVSNGNIVLRPLFK